MNKTMRKTALAALFVLACCVAAHGEPPTEYRTVYSAELPTLNYLDSSTTSVIRMSFSTIDGLVEFDRYGLIMPSLATDWTISDDHRTYTFHIRKGVNCGIPVKAKSTHP